MRLRYWFLIFTICVSLFIISIVLEAQKIVTIPLGVGSLLSFNFIIKRYWSGFRILINICIIGLLIFLFFWFSGMGIIS